MLPVLLQLLSVSACGLIAACTLWGWGRIVQRCGAFAAGSAPLVTAVGLAAVLFIGGLVNVCHIALPVTLDAIVVAGLVAAAVEGWSRRAQFSVRLTPATVIALAPLSAAWVFVALKLVPQAAFNFHDDLEKYLAFPVKMLALGSFSTNPLSSLGAETMGGQAFLDAFVVAHFPLNYVGAVDGLFCFALCIALAGFAVKPGRYALGAIAAELCVIAIDPQSVNISALFSGSALIMAAVILSDSRASETSDLPPAPVLGLIYAGLLALKGTFVPFVAVHLLAIALTRRSSGWTRAGWLLQGGAWIVLFLSPWLLVHARLYLMPATDAGTVGPGAGGDVPQLFSTEKLAYGATQLHYTLLAVGAIATALGIFTATALGWSKRPQVLASVAAASLSAGAIYFAYVSGTGARVLGPLSGTRYACPILIGVIPIGIRLLEQRQSAGRLSLLPAIFGVCVALGFLPSLWTRASQLSRDRVPLAFYAHASAEAKADYVAYNREVMSGTVGAKLAAIQSLVPAGEPMGVWVMAPFLLDFKRNPILHAEPAGLATRWAHLPKEVHYFLLEYSGYAVRPDGVYVRMASATPLLDRISGTRVLRFLDQLKRRASRSRILYNDGSYVLLQLDVL